MDSAVIAVSRIFSSNDEYQQTNPCRTEVTQMKEAVFLKTALLCPRRRDCLRKTEPSLLPFSKTRPAQHLCFVFLYCLLLADFLLTLLLSFLVFLVLGVHSLARRSREELGRKEAKRLKNPEKQAV